MVAPLSLRWRARRALTIYLRRRLIVHGMALAAMGFGLIAGSLGAAAAGPATRTELLEYLGDVRRGLAAWAWDATERFRVTAQADLIRTAAVMWLSGLSLIGAPLVLVLLFLRGFAVGFTGTFLVRELGVEGVLFAGAALVPHNLVALPAALVAAGEALRFAGAGLQTLFGRRRGGPLYAELATYTLALAACGIALVAAAFIEAHLTPVLARAVAGALP